MQIEDIRKYGASAKGKKELVKHLAGQKLTAKEAIHGKCYDCMGGYADGKVDCKIPSCSLYPLMPYREGEKLVMRKVKTEQKERLHEHFWKKEAA